MDAVFLLWHVHKFENGEDDEKLIGVYRSEDDAKGAIQRVAGMPGFVDLPDGFEICRYELNKDHWTEGYVMADVWRCALAKRKKIKSRTPLPRDWGVA